MNLSKILNYFHPWRILDIGANTGQFHIMAKDTFPSSYIFSIEASEACEEFLQKITDQYLIALLTKDSQTYNFYSRLDTQTGTGDSIYRELTSWYNDDNLKVLQKQGIPLDDIFTEDSTFDLIKIDTQGSELDIIKGGIRLCSKAKGILLEVSLVPYNEGAPLYNDVNEYMDSIGFKPAEVLAMNRHPQTGEIIQHDILYVKEFNK